MIPHQYIEKNRQKLVGNLQEMIRVPTVNPPGKDYRKMVDLLGRHCQQLGMGVEIHRVPTKLVEKVVGAYIFLRKSGLKLSKHWIDAVNRWDLKLAYDTGLVLLAQKEGEV